MIEFDWLLVAALSCIALAGVTRGIVGFGAGMIIVTSLAVLYDPITGVIILALLDIPSAIQLGPSIYRHTRWKVIFTLFLSALPLIPVGVWVLSISEPELMRRLISLFVLVFALLNATGWQIRTTPNIATKLFVGGLSGFLTGVATLGGPPIILFFLSLRYPKEVFRSSTLTFLILTTLFALIFYFVNDLITLRHIYLFILATPIYLISMWFGTSIFKRVSEKKFRHIAIVIIMLIALIGIFK